MRTDLEDAIAREASSSPLDRDAEQRRYLSDSLRQFWDALDRIFALAESGKESDARTLIRLSSAGAPGGAQHRGGAPAGAELTKSNNKRPLASAASTPGWSAMCICLWPRCWC
jgi:hypothetical protein